MIRIHGNGVANSCRDILVKFGKELLQNSSKKNDIKKGNSKKIVRFILKDSLPKKRFSETTINLFESTWDHISSALHRPKLQKEEVTRVFIWVILTISEISDLIN